MTLAYILLWPYAAQPGFFAYVTSTKVTLADYPLAALSHAEAKDRSTLKLSCFVAVIVVAVNSVFCRATVICINALIITLNDRSRRS